METYKNNTSTLNVKCINLTNLKVDPFTMYMQYTYTKSIHFTFKIVFNIIPL